MFNSNYGSNKLYLEKFLWNQLPSLFHQPHPTPVQCPSGSPQKTPLNSHHLHSHYLSMPWSFSPDLKLVYFTNPFLRSFSGSIWTAFTDFGLGPDLLVTGVTLACFSIFFLYFLFLVIYVYLIKLTTLRFSVHVRLSYRCSIRQLTETSRDVITFSRFCSRTSQR